MKPGYTRYFFEIAYNGRNYSGWQVQPNSTTVQEVFEDCLRKKLREDTKTYGCGRTDAGVHASQFFVHFGSAQELSSDLVREMNAFLPRDIACKRLWRVSDHLERQKLHARFDAYERRYKYIISVGKDPFGIGLKTSLWAPNMNVELMQQAADVLPEYENFKAFTRLESAVKNHLCEFKWAKWTQEGDDLVFEVCANRFLRSMVRKLVGTMVAIGTGKMTIDQMREAIDLQDPTKTGMVAPPDGLYLTHVFYPENALTLVQ
ncbi:MAG: tRNA pseudouridine(38-40) synthase TruA [Bacteroidetes bacterium]|nr:tRNA pseudouridine(38-40) synthase TruA [Bacteroidota bacterium]